MYKNFLLVKKIKSYVQSNGMKLIYSAKNEFYLIINLAEHKYYVIYQPRGLDEKIFSPGLKNGPKPQAEGRFLD